MTDEQLRDLAVARLHEDAKVNEPEREIPWGRLSDDKSRIVVGSTDGKEAAGEHTVELSGETGQELQRLAVDRTGDFPDALVEDVGGAHPLRQDDHLSLFQASLMSSAPIAGLLVTLIAWGALADRFGERVVIASGVGAAGVFLAGRGIMLSLETYRLSATAATTIKEIEAETAFPRFVDLKRYRRRQNGIR